MTPMKTETIKQFTPEELFAQLKHIKVGGAACQYSLKKCEELVPIINEINRLKAEKNAVILVHSYVTPEILYGVGDFAGDSYGLSKNAMETDARVIIFAAVRFMGDTAKILNPQKDVLVPGLNDGCTLADSITPQDVKRLRREFPKHTFVCYINTTAAVKAECDVCVTSSNVYKVCELIENDKIYFLPDKFMGQNLANDFKERGINKQVDFYNGRCYVHEEYDKDQIFRIRSEYPDAKIVSHPECNPDVIANSDYVGSTAQMLDYMKSAHAKQFLMLTECGLSSRLQKEFPDKHLVGSCTMCRYMKSNRLEDILRCLKNPAQRDHVQIPEEIRQRALKCIEAMFHYAEK